MKPENLKNKLAHTANRLSRRDKQIIQILIDFFVLMWAAALAIWFRLGFEHVFTFNQMAMIVGAPLTAIPLFVRFGLYRAVLRYLPERALISIFNAVVAASLVWVTLAFFTGSYGGEGVPRTVPILYGVLAFLFVSVSRFAAKWLLLSTIDNGNRRRTLIYGAGQSGIQLAASLHDSGDAHVLGFVDDKPDLHGRDVAGLRVYSPPMLPSLVKDLGVEEVILCVPTAPGPTKIRIGSLLAALPVKVRTLSARANLKTERFSISSLEKLEISELVGRSAVPPNQALIESVIRGKRILITGAGGSIGSQLARLVDASGPRELFLIDNSEFALFNVARSLNNARQFFPMHLLLGSVAQERFMRRVLNENKIDVVFHAAAYKHVDMVERNVREGIRNNVLGTEIVARTAFETGVKQFVLISTDKAVNPTSVMGATKRVCELIVRNYAEKAAEAETDQDFLAVRFGNVIGSSGSVIPLFAKQIEEGGPVTVTDRNATRYFMAVSEAVELIVQSAALSRGGETFLLDMGDPISIYDLARDMIALAGLSVKDEDNPEGDVAIEFIGLRPGEKLHEELWYSADSTVGSSHPKIMMAKRRSDAHLKIGGVLAQLREGLEESDETELRDKLLSLTASLNRLQYENADSRVIPLPVAAKASAG